MPGRPSGFKVPGLARVETILPPRAVPSRHSEATSEKFKTCIDGSRKEPIEVSSISEALPGRGGRRESTARLGRPDKPQLEPRSGPRALGGRGAVARGRLPRRLRPALDGKIITPQPPSSNSALSPVHPHAPLWANEPKCLAVLDFDYVPLMNSRDPSVTPGATFGRAVTERLLVHLTGLSEYTIVERTQLEKIKAELNLTEGKDFDSSRRTGGRQPCVERGIQTVARRR